MGYFSNGTEGLIYQEHYCFNCRNWGRDPISQQTETEGCPIWDAHFAYAYEVTDTDTPAEHILNALIPREEPGLNGNGQCTMFYPKLALVKA